jgi:hypothetical protein
LLVPPRMNTAGILTCFMARLHKQTIDYATAGIAIRSHR